MICGPNNGASLKVKPEHSLVVSCASRLPREWAFKPLDTGSKKSRRKIVLEIGESFRATGCCISRLAVTAHKRQMKLFLALLVATGALATVSNTARPTLVPPLPIAWGGPSLSPERDPLRS